MAFGGISSLITKPWQAVRGLRPFDALKKLKNIAQVTLDKVTFGRGLKVWQAPKVKLVKSKDDFYEFKLSNGMKVLYKKNNLPMINANLIIRSGSVKDPDGKSGLTHFLEHMKFHNSKFGERIDQVVKYLGGNVNAITTEDSTQYPITIPIDKANLAFDYLSSILDPVDFTEEDLQKEKSILTSEIANHRSSPVRILTRKLAQNLFGEKNPYIKSTNFGGDPDEIASLTNEELKQFQVKEYTASNSTLVISGSLSLADLKSKLKIFFGKKPQIDKSPDLDFSIDTSRFTDIDRHMKVNDKHLSNMVTLEYQHRPVSSKVAHKLELSSDILTSALSGGARSRLYKRLVETQLVTSIDVSADFARANSALSFSFNIPEGADYESTYSKVKQIIDEELDDILQNGLSQEEFTRILKSVQYDDIYKKDNPEADFGGVLSYMTKGWDWEDYTNYNEDLKSITNDDIQDFIKQYVSKDHLFITKMKNSGDDLDQGIKQVSSEHNLDVVKNLERFKALHPSDIDQINSLVGGLTKVQAKLSHISKFKEDGYQVAFKEDHSKPLVFGKLSVDTGSLTLDDSNDVTPILTKALFKRFGVISDSLGKLTKQEFSDLLDESGGDFGYKFRENSLEFFFDSPSEQLNKTLDLAKEMFNYPWLLEEKDPDILKQLNDCLDFLKKQMIANLKKSEELTHHKLIRYLKKVIYPKGHIAYPLSLEQEIQAINSVTLAGIRKFYRENIQAQTAKLTVVGDCTKEDIQSKVIPTFKSINADTAIQASKKSDRIKTPELPTRSVKVFDTQEDKANTNVLISNSHDIKETDPDYYAAKMLINILGEGFNSRLMKKIREELGLVYNIESSLISLNHRSGLFDINLSCKPQDTKRVVAEVMKLVNDFLKNGITDAELDLEKSDFKASRGMYACKTFDSTCKTVHDLMCDNRDEKFFNSLNARIDSITVDDLKRVAKRVIKPDSFTIIATKPKSAKADAFSALDKIIQMPLKQKAAA